MATHDISCTSNRIKLDVNCDESLFLHVNNCVTALAAVFLNCPSVVSVEVLCELLFLCSSDLFLSKNCQCWRETLQCKGIPSQELTHQS